MSNKCKQCRKLITHNYHVGSFQINGTVALHGCEHFEEIRESVVVSYPIHDFGSEIGQEEQLEKIDEEFMEVLKALRTESTHRTIEECCDLIQATFNMIEILSPGGVQSALELHTRKMIDRGYPVKYFIEMNEVRK